MLVKEIAIGKSCFYLLPHIDSKKSNNPQLKGKKYKQSFFFLFFTGAGSDMLCSTDNLLEVNEPVFGISC